MQVSYAHRYFDSWSARWCTPDPLAQKYPSWSPYNYGLCNPIMNIDPNGDSVDVARAQQQDAQSLNNIIADAQHKTGLTVTTASGSNGTVLLQYAKDSNGNPIIATDENGNQIGSAEARNLLISGIDAPDVAHLSFNSDKSSRAQIGGLMMSINPAEVQSFINGSVGVNSTTMGWAMTFFHELSHTLVGGGLSDGTKAWGSSPGP